MRLLFKNMHRPEFKKKLEIYNEYYQDKPNLQIFLKEEENPEELVCSGNLKVYWGIVQPIRLKLKDDKSAVPDFFNRHSYGPADSNKESQLDYFMKLSKSSNSNLEETIESPAVETGNRLPGLSNHVGRSQSTVIMRPNRRRPVRKRLSIINGHLFSAETSMFTPMHGTLMNVNVSTHDSTLNVIKTILHKFKVDNSPAEFCLCAVRASGETHIFNDNNTPLVERIHYGPLEDDVKFFLVEKYRVVNINEEVASFVNLPEAILDAFLLKYSEDEKLELELIKEKYRLYKEKLEELLGDVQLQGLEAS